ncbi:MAG: AAA family ATPase [Lachnospiraceae bacterium]
MPRFNSAGGDGGQAHVRQGGQKSLTFGDGRIREAVEKYHAKLLILDPMSSYIGDTCSMNNANETRAEFNRLIAAKDTGCAIVIIAHMNKAKDTSLLYRTNGSIDIASAARSISSVARTANKQNPAERYLVQVKSNLAPMGSAILLEVADTDEDDLPI